MFGNKNKEAERFIIVSVSRIPDGFMKIYKDRETGVLYCCTEQQNGVGITPLLDSTGKPIIEPIE